MLRILLLTYSFLLMTSQLFSSADTDKMQNYNDAVEEGWIDRIVGTFASMRGHIIHGKMDEIQLKSRLDKFNINNLMTNGPVESDLLSKEAQELILMSLNDLPKVYDVHLHNLGYDEGNFLNPKAAAMGTATTESYLTFTVLRYAAGMSKNRGSTQEARRRIQLYVQNFPKVTAFILPIHPAISPGGKVDWENTGNYLSNESALTTALTFKDGIEGSTIVPATSVHPFDMDWKQKLHDAHEKGIRLVKWMPPQSIQPDSPHIDEYYKTLVDLNMTLIAHSGPEHALPALDGNKEWEDWGNPLRFRNALKLGVNVILAHSGHRDFIPDLDNPGQNIRGYQLFFRLAKEAHQKNISGEWKGKLYGDLGAVTTFYGPDFVKELLLHVNEPGVRIIYGSDYPYTNLIADDAYEMFEGHEILEDWMTIPLQEIRAWNPLLANFIFARMIKYEGISFPDSTFTGNFKDGALYLYDEEVWKKYKESINLISSKKQCADTSECRIKIR